MSHAASQIASSGATSQTRCFVVLAILAAFGLVSSDWAMSGQFQTQEDMVFQKQEKTLEKRPADPSPTSASGFLLLGIAGTVASLRKPLRPTAWTNPVVIACLAFACWCVLSILWSPSPALSMRKTAILVLFFLGTIGLARLLTLRDLCWVAALSCAGFLGIGLLAEISQGNFRPHQSGYRFCGTFHPNDQGLQCAVLILASLCLLWQGTRHDRLLKCFLAAGAVGLLLTKSRTALAALACALLLAFLLRARGKQRLLAASSLTALGALAVLVYSFLPMGAVKSTADVASMGRSGNVESLTGRIPLWTELTKEISTRPWLGSSYGGFWSTSHIHRYSEMFEWQIPNAHNAYLDVLLAVGIVGLTLYLCWILGAWFVSLVTYERSDDSADLFACCLIAFSIVHGFAESKFPFPGMSSAFLFLSVFVLTAQPAADRAANSRDSTIRRTPELRITTLASN